MVKNESDFIKVIKARMNELNMNNEDLANKMGVSPSTISRYLNGDIDNMRRDNIISMSNALGISPSELMGWFETKDEKTIIINRAVSKMSDSDKEKLIGLLDVLFDDVDR